jgi:hypothetical protein
MPRDTEQAVIYLRQVRIGDSFYSGPTEVRAWMRGWPTDEGRLQPVKVPVQRGRRGTQMNGKAQVWVRPGDEIDR